MSLLRLVAAAVATAVVIVAGYVADRLYEDDFDEGLSE